MKAIFKKEFKGFFNSTIGWLFIGITFALYGLYFFAYNLSNSYPYISYPLTGMMFIYIITTPIITMRMLAEERKNKTDQMILTAPVTVGGIVFGKYLALVAINAIINGVIAITPLILAKFGEVPFASSYVSLLGFFLYGCACLAIGLFISSLTENSLVSAVVTFIVIFLGYMMSSITGVIFSNDSIIAKILCCYDLYNPLQDMLDGQLNLVGVVYYLSVIGLMLFLTIQSIQKRRWSFSNKKLSGNIFSVSLIVVVLVCVIAGNYGVNKIPSKYTSFDASGDNYTELTEDTIKYLESLDKEMNVYVMSAKKSADEYVVDTLSNMQDVSKKINVEYIDTEKNPTFATQYTDESLPSSSVIVTCGDKSTVINFNDMFEMQVDYSSYSYVATGYDGEGQLMMAFQYLLTENMPYVYVLNGHDEGTVSTSYVASLVKSNVGINDLTLLTVDAVPDDCSLLIINGPATDFSDDDLQKITDYVDLGGKVYISINFEKQSELINVNKFLEKYGFEAVSGVVVDNDRSYYTNTPFYLLPYVNSTSDSANLTGNAAVLVPYSAGINHKESGGITYTDIMNSSEDSVSKVNYATASDYAFEDGDIKGPFAIMSKGEMENGGCIYVCGSADYLAVDDYNKAVSGRNATLFTSIVNNCIGETNNASIVIPVKEYSMNYLTITESNVRLLGLIIGVLGPIVLIIVGIVLSVQRKRR